MIITGNKKETTQKMKRGSRMRRYSMQFVHTYREDRKVVCSSRFVVMIEVIYYIGVFSMVLFSDYCADVAGCTYRQTVHCT